MNVVRKQTTVWYAEDRKIIEEHDDGHFDVTDWHCLDEARLKRLHFVLGELLTHLASERTKELVAKELPC